MGRTWRQDGAFIGWLVKMNYVHDVDGEPKHSFTGDGIVIYMWEAWLAGRQIELDQHAEDAAGENI